MAIKSILIFLIILSSSCAVQQNHIKKSTIAGTWCELDVSGEVCIGYMIHYADGSYFNYGGLFDKGVGWYSWGKWNVDSANYCITPLKRDFFRVPSGRRLEPWAALEPRCSELVSVKNDELVYRSALDNSVAKMILVSSDQIYDFIPGEKPSLSSFSLE